MNCRRSVCLALLTFPPLLSSCQIGYVVSQGCRQLTLNCDQVPLDSPSLEQALTALEREKLAWITKVVDYCRAELGLDPGDAYSTFLDTGGKPISYVVTAAHPLALVPYRWRFPFVGAVSYKGFFNLEDAEAEVARLLTAGFDAALHPVEAYSTLGWFRDPILSTMLERDLTDLIDLIIHETTHRTIYLEDHTSFNESLATHVAAEGTERFLHAHAELLPLLAEFQARQKRSEQRGALLARLYRDLDALYRSSLPDSRKLALKKALFQTASRADELVRGDSGGDSLPASNALVLAFARYHEFEPVLRELQAKLGGHPRHLTAYLLEFMKAGKPLSDLLRPDRSLTVASLEKSH